MTNREIDVLIAQKVFGHNVVHTTWGKNKQYECYTIGEPEYYYTSDDPQGIRMNEVPYYSDDIEAAWTVLDSLKDCVVEVSYDYNNNYWCCCMQGGKVEVYNQTAPRAICEAALKVYNITT
jgi:hypothetical protein